MPVSCFFLWNWVYIQWIQCIFLLTMFWMLLTCQMTITSKSLLALQVSIELIPKIARVESDGGIWLDLLLAIISGKTIPRCPQVLLVPNSCCWYLLVNKYLHQLATSFTVYNNFTMYIDEQSGEQLKKVPIAVNHLAPCFRKSQNAFSQQTLQPTNPSSPKVDNHLMDPLVSMVKLRQTKKGGHRFGINFGTKTAAPFPACRSRNHCSMCWQLLRSRMMVLHTAIPASIAIRACKGITSLWKWNRSWLYIMRDLCIPSETDSIP